jgi:hypothetical protein
VYHNFVSQSIFLCGKDWKSARSTNTTGIQKIFCFLQKIFCKPAFFFINNRRFFCRAGLEANAGTLESLATRTRRPPKCLIIVKFLRLKFDNYSKKINMYLFPKSGKVTGFMELRDRTWL